MRSKSPKQRKKSPRKPTKLRGGKILGKGGYGCVVALDDSTVGKINFGNFPMYKEFGIESLQQFMNIQQQIYKADPEEKYFITTRGIIEMQSNDPKIIECIEYDKNPPDVYQVFVQTRVSISPPLEDWTKDQVQHAIDGLFLLHRHGFVHNDVSKRNFGFKNGMPVYIDMDGASEMKPERVRFNKGKYFVDLNETSTFDFQQLQKSFSK